MPFFSITNIIIVSDRLVLGFPNPRLATSLFLPWHQSCGFASFPRHELQWETLIWDRFFLFVQQQTSSTNPPYTRRQHLLLHSLSLKTPTSAPSSNHGPGIISTSPIASHHPAVAIVDTTLGHNATLCGSAALWWRSAEWRWAIKLRCAGCGSAKHL